MTAAFVLVGGVELVTRRPHSPVPANETQREWCAVKLPRYRHCLRFALESLRVTWDNYLAAIDLARRVDELRPDADWDAPALLEQRECAARLVAICREQLYRRLASVRLYQDAIRTGEQARAEMLPVLCAA